MYTQVLWGQGYGMNKLMIFEVITFKNIEHPDFDEKAKSHFPKPIKYSLTFWTS